MVAGTNTVDNLVDQRELMIRFIGGLAEMDFHLFLESCVITVISHTAGTVVVHMFNIRN